ncbi:hypothetical protein D3C81_106670 [compost metagenome]
MRIIESASPSASDVQSELNNRNFVFGIFYKKERKRVASSLLLCIPGVLRDS